MQVYFQVLFEISQTLNVPQIVTCWVERVLCESLWRVVLLNLNQEEIADRLDSNLVT